MSAGDRSTRSAAGLPVYAHPAAIYDAGGDVLVPLAGVPSWQKLTGISSSALPYVFAVGSAGVPTWMPTIAAWAVSPVSGVGQIIFINQDGSHPIPALTVNNTALGGLWVQGMWASNLLWLPATGGIARSPRTAAS